MDRAKRTLEVLRINFIKVHDEIHDILTKNEYQNKVIEVHSKIKLMVEQLSPRNLLESQSNTRIEVVKSKLKRPTLEFRKFGGDLKDWLSFWSQFRKIHEDFSIDNEEKFQYLVQATIPNSRARQLVESYPCTTENYHKVIEGLTCRFGNSSMLVEVYVRELLKLVLNNVQNKSKLSTFYDKIESQIRALETLGVTSETCAAMLYPLVESCMDEELIRIWQRSSLNTDDLSLKQKLDNLLKFMQKEVQNEERVALAVIGFDIQNKSKIKVAEEIHKKSIPTASDLINKTSFTKCLFCKEAHNSEDCLEAKSLSLEEKKKKITDNGCCFICLKFGHVARRCKCRVYCTDCRGKHVTLMCPRQSQLPNNSNTIPHSEITLVNPNHSQIFLQTLAVNLISDNRIRRARVIIDTGSQKSYVTKNAAIEMEYDSIEEEQIIHSLFGGTETETITHSIYRIRVRSLTNEYACNFESLDQTVICNYVQSVAPGPWIQELQDFNIELTDTEDGPIDILIGSDIAGKIYTGNRQELKCGLVAVETKLGWCLMGKINQNDLRRKTTSSMIVTSMFSKNMALPELWTLDVLGIRDPIEMMSQKENEKKIMEYFLQTVKRQEDGRYIVSMPWIDDHPPLNTNFEMALKRLENVCKRLKREGYYDEYQKVFDEWLEEEIIEEVTEDLKNTKLYGHFLSHHPVIKLSSATTKIRPVFDASAKQNGFPSLNQCLEKGINLIEKIPSLLIRFRLDKIGVIADIRRAFLQINLTDSDRDFVKFLWYDKSQQLKVFRHARVVFGITCSPFLLGAVIFDHLQNALMKSQSGDLSYSEAVIKKLINSFYVDNCVTSLNNQEALTEFIENSSKLMQEAQFELRCWEYTLTEDCVPQNLLLSPVLGLLWNRRFDTLELALDWLEKTKIEKITKRKILAIVQKLFDPIGFSCPVTLYPKLLLQKTWIEKIGWDKELDSEMQRQFLKWTQELPALQNLKIPRWYRIPGNRKSLSLHIFCDASKCAYASCIYLRSETSLDVNVCLIQAKSRVAPIKKLSIPRLELLSATIGARLYNTIKDNFDGNIPAFFYSDSSTVLAWVRGNEVWKPYVWNRVEEFSIVEKIRWIFIPPAAPWWGGWWERLIALIKEVLRKTLFRSTLDYEEMLTVLYGAEATINTRPLTYLSEDSNDLVALTPAMFIQEISNIGTADIDSIEASSLRRHIRYRAKLREDIRKRFRNEYLGKLKLFRNKKNQNLQVKEGDVVLIGDNNIKRISWPLAKIEKLICGKDGNTRLARLKTADGAEDDVHRFVGNDTHTDFFRLVMRDGDYLLIGGRNVVYNVTLADMQEQQRLTWYSHDQDAKMCVMKGKDEENCQNYIRIMAKTQQGRLLLCGTNAFKPLCREYNVVNRNYTMEKEKPGQAVCPYDPHHNSTAIYVDGDLYTGTVADFSGMDPIIYREPLQTEQYDSMSLNAPDFVGSMTQGDFVYFFFRETAVEYINCGKAVYSRVARVCKNDRGGPHRFRNRWTSFLKSRLNCSVTGEFPFAFNEIQSTSDLIDGKYGDVSAQLIYGTFTTPPNSISGSAVCAFSLQDITDTFEGNFKEQAAINSNWLPVLSNKVPDPRPGQCHNDSRTLPDLTLNFIKTHSLMDESVPSFFGMPIVVRTSFHYRFTQIAVDPQVKVPGGKSYDVLFIGTDNGKIIKAVNGVSADSRHGVRPVVIEEIQVLPTHVPVRGLRILKGGKKGREETRLIIVSDSEVQSLRVHRCDSNKISSCSECVALQDPYCAWDKIQGKCRSNGGSGRWTEESLFFQSVATGEHAACPPPKLQGKDAGSVGGLSSSQPKFINSDHQPSNDKPDGQVINIIQDKPYDNSGPAVTATESLPNHYTVETLIMAVVAGSVSALVVGFFAGYLCGRKCHKDEDDNLPYPDTEYEYFEQRQNMNSRIAAEPKLLPQEEVTYAEPVLVPQPPPKLHSPKNTLRKAPHQNNAAETLFQFQTDGGYNPRDTYRGRDNFGTLRSHQLLQGDNNYRPGNRGGGAGDGFATTRSVKKVYL